MKFDQLSLDETILAAVDAAGFEECTEVQERAIPKVLEGRDVAVQSQTGTGKTAAFLLPIFQLLRNNERFQNTRVLIIAPTRELAVQIQEESDLLSRDLGLKSAVFYGGVGYQTQHKALKEGAQILVGTPGRLIDLNQSGHFDFRDIGILVIDEADRLFDMGFYPDLRKMLQRMRPREERLNMLFSATLSVKARNIAWEHMNDPVEIEIEPEQVTVERVEQRLFHVAADEKMRLLLGLLKKYSPKNAIVFTNTKKQAEIVAKRLSINGYPAEYIIGDLPQKKRLTIINRIKKGESEFLVATDVAARGLHINSLDMVFNYDVPEDPEAYVHRIGRTARAGETGQAFMLACERYVFGLEAIEKLIGMKIPVDTLAEDVLVDDLSRETYIRLENEDSRHSPRRDSRRDSRRSGPRRTGRSGSARNDRPKSDRSTGDHPRSDRGRSERSRSDRPKGDHQKAAAGRSGSGRSGASRSRTGTARGDEHRQRKVHRSQEAPRRKDSLEERLSYYREKYGEDFQPTGEMLRNLETERKDRRGRGSKRKERAPLPVKETAKQKETPEEKRGFLSRLFKKK